MFPAPSIIFWELTKRCNLKCAYCKVANKGFGPELDTTEAKALISNIKNEFPNTLLILSGGEPTLRKDLFEILAFAFLAGLKTSLATNGTLLDERKILKLKETGLKRISVSLDSAEEKTHDISRGLHGSFRKAVTACGILKKHNIPFQINFTVTKSKIGEIDSIADLAFLLGAEAVHYFMLIVTGQAKEIAKKEMLKSNDLDKAMLRIKKLSQKSPIELKPTCIPQYIRLEDKNVSCGCLAANRVFFISSSGDVYPCGYLPVKAGSVRKTPIAAIWQDSSLFKELRQGGLSGCRARAYSFTRDYAAPDPLWPKAP